MQGKEEKQLDASLESIIQKVHELKQYLLVFLFKLEHEYQTLNWTTMLDNFALISGQINMLNRSLKSDKMSILKNYVAVPFSLSPDIDPNLEKLTEGRVPFFNHEVVPNYLRTKPEPEIEDRIVTMHNRAHSISSENLQKQINTLNKLSNIIQENLKNSRDSLDSDPVQKGMFLQMTTSNDTNNLVAAMVSGKGLKPQSSSMVQMNESRSSSAVSQQVMSSGNINKVPNPIKTNIKAGINSTNYNR